MDGSSSVDTLAFVALNTTSQPLDIELNVVAGDGVQQTASAPYSVRIPGYNSSSFTVRVAELGLSDWPVATRVSARYAGTDGLSHRTGLETVWLRSTSDFQHATVRSAANESRMNALSALDATLEA